MVIKLFMAISFSQWPASGSSGDIVSGSAARFEDGGLVKTQKISGNNADHQGGLLASIPSTRIATLLTCSEKGCHAAANEAVIFSRDMTINVHAVT